MEQKILEKRKVNCLLGMSRIIQDAIVYKLPENWNQKKISPRLQKDSFEKRIIDQIPNAVKIPIETFQSIDKEQEINSISNTFGYHSNKYIGIRF